VIVRAQTIHDGMAADKATYGDGNPPLPAFQGLIQSTLAAHQAVRLRTVGAKELRDVQVNLLWSAMETERSVIQAIADANPSRAASIITNGGLLLYGINVQAKALLTVKPSRQSGALDCSANVGLLVGAGEKNPHQNRFFNWGYTIDGSKSFIALPSTSKSKTTLVGLTPLTLVGVRVSLTNGSGPGPWSPVVYSVVL
jgi:hypothetical protein